MKLLKVKQLTLVGVIIWVEKLTAEKQDFKQHKQVFTQKLKYECTLHP
jgi:hypothetical protein